MTSKTKQDNQTQDKKSGRIARVAKGAFNTVTGAPEVAKIYSRHKEISSKIWAPVKEEIQKNHDHRGTFETFDNMVLIKGITDEQLQQDIKERSRLALQFGFICVGLAALMVYHLFAGTNFGWVTLSLVLMILSAIKYSEHKWRIDQILYRRFIAYPVWLRSKLQGIAR